MRSGDKQSPFPEEINRVLTGHLSDFHFAPTDAAKEHLAKESIKDNVWVVGNTVIDALFTALDLIDKKKVSLKSILNILMVLLAVLKESFQKTEYSS